ncbi:MAG: hypothetical protein ACTS4Z_01040 [Candidatus Hodgkinia cicadicola]
MDLARKKRGNLSAGGGRERKYVRRWNGGAKERTKRTEREKEEQLTLIVDLDLNLRSLRHCWSCLSPSLVRLVRWVPKVKWVSQPSWAGKLTLEFVCSPGMVDSFVWARSLRAFPFVSFAEARKGNGITDAEELRERRREQRA